MLFVPVTFLTAAGLAFVLLRIVTQRDMQVPANRMFAALVGLYLAQSLLVTLRWGYGVEGLRLPGAMLAAVLPAMAWAVWRALTGRIGAGEAWAAVPVAVSWVALLLWPEAADGLIPLTYLGFGLAILGALLKDRDAPALTPIAEAGATRRAMGLIAATLIASSVTDAVILADFVMNGGRISARVISVVQTVFVLAVGTAAAFGRSAPSEPEAVAPPAPAEVADHEAVLARIDWLFAAEGLHRQEDLSLRRLARRLGLPDRRVSEAVNRQRGINLSQFINEYRIRDACALLRQGDQSILQVALSVGFASKSNFNREFQRVMGQTPSAWRQAGVAAP